jgi:ribosomal protein L29
MIKAGGNVENPARLKELHRAIAKLLTIQHEERLGLRKVKTKKKERKKEKKTK